MKPCVVKQVQPLDDGIGQKKCSTALRMLRAGQRDAGHFTQKSRRAMLM
jgi:hypothetical protein